MGIKITKIGDKVKIVKKKKDIADSIQKIEKLKNIEFSDLEKDIDKLKDLDEIKVYLKELSAAVAGLIKLHKEK